MPVPPTIQALLAARLDRLSAEERAVIQRASVVGKVFFRGAVAAMSPELDRAAVGAHLLALVRKELARPDRSTLPGEDAFRFRHLLIRDAAYESIPKELRAELHERFAGWLGDVAGERLEEQEEILAYHLEQAYRYREELGPVDERSRELGRRASRHLAAAGRRAFARGDMTGSVNLLGRAVRLLPRGEPGRLALLPDLAFALGEVGAFDDALASAAEAIEDATAAGDRRTASHARLAAMLGRVAAEPEGITEAATRVADEVIPVFEELGDELGLARAWRLRSTAPWLLSRFAEMESHAERAVEHARRAGSAAEEIAALDMLGIAVTFGPKRPDEGIRRLEEIRRESDSRRVNASMGPGIALFQAMQGRFEAARESISRGRGTAEDLGRSVMAAGILLGWGFVELLAGDPVAAERKLRRGRDEFLGVGEKGMLSTLSAVLARALCLQGRRDEAEPFIEESRELAASEDVYSQMAWRTSMAMVLAARGDLEGAEALAREAVGIGRPTDDIDLLAEAIGDLAEVVAARGRGGEAADLLREAVELFERKGNVVSAGRARERLAELEGGSAGP